MPFFPSNLLPDPFFHLPVIIFWSFLVVLSSAFQRWSGRAFQRWRSGASNQAASFSSRFGRSLFQGENTENLAMARSRGIHLLVVSCY